MAIHREVLSSVDRPRAADTSTDAPKADHAGIRPFEGSLLRSLQRRWPLAILVGLVLGCAAAAAMWVLRPAKYTAFSLVKVDSERPEILPRDRPNTDMDVYRSTQTALIKSPKVLEAVLNDEKIRNLSIVKEEPEPFSWLDGALGVEAIRSTELLRVSLSGRDPEQTAQIVNAIVDAYLQEVVNQDQQNRQAKLNDLKKVCEQSEVDLRVQRKKLQNVAESLKASDQATASLRLKVALEEYVALRKDLIALGAELRQVSKYREGGTREASSESTGVSEAALEQALDDHPEVLAEAKKVTQAEELLSQMKTNALPGFRGITDAETSVSTAKDALAAVRKRLRKSMEGKVRQRLEMETQLAMAKQSEREAVLKEQNERIKKEVEEARNTADKIGLDAIVYETERTGIDQGEKMIKSLWAERDRLEVEGRSTVHRITKEVEATRPRTKNRKPQLLAAGLAGFAVCMIGAFAVAYWDFRSGRVYSKDDVAQVLRLRILGALPVMNHKSSHAKGSQGKYPKGGHLWTESLNRLRTILLHEASLHSLRVVLVTSGGPHEGKTTLARHLAASLAAAGRRTLLIDGDLRCPALHKEFGLHMKPGLCEALREECSTSAAIHPTSIPGLYLLPGGVFGDSVVDLLARGRLKTLLEPLRSEYDAIVIDSSPLMAVNDGLLIGQNVDAVLLSIRPRQSRMPMVHEACARLQALDIPVLGTVVNGLRPGHRDLQMLS